MPEDRNPVLDFVRDMLAFVVVFTFIAAVGAWGYILAYQPPV